MILGIFLSLFQKTEGSAYNLTGEDLEGENIDSKIMGLVVISVQSLLD